MDSQSYIASGIIEDYCLGMLNDKENNAVEQYAQLHADVKQEIDAYMQALEQYALDNAVKPDEQLKTQIFQLIDNLEKEQEANPQHLPLLNKYSDLDNWLKIVEPLLPGQLEEDMFVKELRNEDGVSQIIIWTKVDYPDEVHDEGERLQAFRSGLRGIGQHVAPEVNLSEHAGRAAGGDHVLVGRAGQ